MSPLKGFKTARDFISAWRAPLTRYERHISAAAMLGGFAIDNFTFGRVDRPAANIIFTAYLGLAALTIAVLHRMQARADRKLAQALTSEKERRKRLRSPALEPRQSSVHAAATTVDAAASFDPVALHDSTPAIARAEKGFRFGRWLHGALPAATQFALGGLMSGFLVFYSRSAVFAASWPFLLLLAAIFIGNEAFRGYRDRLVFTGLLFFFLLYSYAIFVVPVLFGRMGSLTFAVSGLLAIVVFVVFLRLLQALGRERYRQTRGRLVGGALAVLALMNLFYFTDILPPLPLALANAGVYHAVKRTGAVYTATTEPEAMGAMFNLSRPVLHLAPGEPVSVYSAVFAPIKLTTRITHRWLWYDPARKKWLVQSVVSYAISGGRDGGFRGYTIKTKPKPGSWRVDIDTADGRLVGRVSFDIDAVTTPVPTVPKTIP
jgi:hypothetical protein